jgi:hypothetical protein
MAGIRPSRLPGATRAFFLSRVVAALTDTITGNYGYSLTLFLNVLN